jgi:ubiquinone/menaquinone biosynthesis C-methylase UbiE
MAYSQWFWDAIAKRYSRQTISDETAYQHKLHVTQSYLSAESDVLEFGCGTGSTAIAHAGRVRPIRGIDVSPNMLAIAREKAPAAAVKNGSSTRPRSTRLASQMRRLMR